ncbi:hypothetical protein BH24ACT26_BH24ACT26_13720 [soil metagenome]
MVELEASYVLPLRWRSCAALAETSGYLRRLAAWMEVIVVDGSPPEVFAEMHEACGDVVHHLRPAATPRALNGKVRGVLTGVSVASRDKVIVADDDVRYDESTITRMVELLDGADLVRPQNYFDPLPWHARWDGARSLINRALGGDYPGTLAIRRSLLTELGGYDGDVLFENLELMRTMSAGGGRLLTPMDLYVRRIPPTASHFWSQRVRQAYDDFAMPLRMTLFLTILPALYSTLRRRSSGLAALLVASSIALAEAGRRRGGAVRVFPATTSLFAPAWVLERAACSWLALAARVLRGGCRYGDLVIARAATPQHVLRRRFESHRRARSRT